MTLKAVIFLFFMALNTVLLAQEAVRADGIAFTVGELRHAYANTPPQIQRAAAADETSRYEFLANLIASKKIKADLDALSPETDGETYYRYVFAMLEAVREFDKKLHAYELELPDFEALAEERYRISKGEIAMVSEVREASHLLLLCGQECDEEEKENELEGLRARILDGEPFDELATEFSQDPGSKTRGGRLSRGIEQDAVNVDQTVRDALFGLQSVGDISQVVKSRFGFHIIKLESIIPARERTFEEVKIALIAEVEKRYREDAYREHLLSFAPTEPLVIDKALVDSVLGPLPTPTN